MFCFVFTGFSDYDSKMLYLQGLNNLQVGNVANYLDPIVKDESENPDIKFLAAWASMPTAEDRPEKVNKFISHCNIFYVYSKVHLFFYKMTIFKFVINVLQ